MSLRKKIMYICVGSILFVSFIIGAFLIIRMSLLRGDVVQSNSEYTNTVSAMSSESMTAQVRQIGRASCRERV